MSESFELSDAPAAPPAYLDSLNPAQRQAVEAIDGPVLVLAGAGTGKTRVLTTRLAHLLHLRRARPWEILAVTFTNRAAREMRDRVAALVGPGAESLWLGTFHALGARLLRRHAELVGLRSNFTILDTDDQIRLLKQLLVAENIDDKKWPARLLMGVIQRWKDRGLTPEDVTTADVGDLAAGRLQALYADYQERLKVLNAADFGDLLLHVLTIFKSNADVLADYQQQFRYLLVDEYQDTNVAQYLLLRLLAQGHHNIACVGDDDQSIYAWRGAEVGNILRFEKDFPGAQVIRLEQNYRSTQHILDAAGGLIAHNEGRLGKSLWTDTDGGDPVAVRGTWDGEEEARTVADLIEDEQRRHGLALNDVAVLVRAGFQTREFEERFLTVGMPYRVIGGPRFYERQEIRDALAYLRVIHQPDDDLAFERIVNKPKRGIGEATVQTIHQAARAENASLTRAARGLLATDELKPRARAALGELVDNFDRWRHTADGLPHTELAQIVLDESGYTAMLLADKSPEAPGRLENLKELIVAMEEFENLAGFLEHVSLVMENTEAAGSDMVSIMTLHSAKGLEFDTVFLPGWEEDLFPNRRSLDESGMAGLEEERRLAYVGLTRAKRQAHVLYAANRRIHGQWQSALPSRFVEELPKNNVDVTTPNGLYGNTGGRGAYGGSFGDSYGGALGGGFGQRRARYRRDRRTDLIIEATAERVDAAPAGGFAVGERVFHQKFGYGRILAADAGKLEIAFDKAGTKKVLDSFVVPADAV